MSNSGIVNGEKFDDSIKINGFDYVKFNKFLKDNNAICISKVHHAEERLIPKSMESLKLQKIQEQYLLLMIADLQ